MSERRPLRFTVDGVQVHARIRDGDVLYWVLARALDTPPPRGCGVGYCGTCTVLLDGQPVRPCVLPADIAEGAQIVIPALPEPPNA